MQTSRKVPRLFSVKAISDGSTIPASTIYTLVARGELPAVRIGSSIRIAEADWLAFIERRMWWAGVGVSIVLLARVLVPSNRAGLHPRLDESSITN